MTEEGGTCGLEIDILCALADRLAMQLLSIMRCENVFLDMMPVKVSKDFRPGSGSHP